MHSVVKSSRKTIRIKENKKIKFLDQIDFKHIMDSRIIQYYNLVEH